MADKVYLAKKDGSVVYHTDKTAMMDIDGVVPELSVSMAEWEASGGLARIIAGKITLGKTETEKASEAEIAALGNECGDLQSELDAKDYKVIKAAEDGIALASADPELHKRRDWCRGRISEIRLRLAELDVKGAR